MQRHVFDAVLGKLVAIDGAAAAHTPHYTHAREADAVTNQAARTYRLPA